MTTSAIGSRSERSVTPKGYTILEMCLVLFIIALVAGAAVPLTVNLLTEQRVQRAARQLELMARNARHQAIVSQQRFMITLRENSFSLEPAPDNRSEHAEKSRTEVYDLPSGMALQIKSWQEPAWRKPDATEWYFEPNGLTEPMQIQFGLGDVSVEQTFDPLTALAQYLH